MDLISIIVPVYNVQEYLCACVDSICSQTYRELEIILIDDGSTDSSGRICDRYARHDNRIRVIHQEHEGPSGARNAGLQTANGEYISFIDSDDMVSCNFIKRLYSIMKKRRAQISVCAYEKSETGEWSPINRGEDYCISSEKMLREWHGKRKRLETVVWNKLYHKSIFGSGAEQIYFPEGVIHEDTYVSHLWVKKADTVAITNDILYMYRVRGGSITKSRITKQNARQDIDAQLARLSFFRQEGLLRSQCRLLPGLALHALAYKVKGNL
ncbi:MAG: glycosyltransferase [Lachnospiraceae bacterium]|nr:glycosyltransferase [Lachnospiraceae bacterium]